MSYSHEAQEQWVTGLFPEGYKGFAIDVGANDGVFFSNSMALEEKGWTVLCVEADDRYMDSCCRIRKLVANCAVGAPGEPWRDFYRAVGPPSASNQALGHARSAGFAPARVAVLTLDQLLHVFHFPQLDFLTMDIEGGEWDALQGFDLPRWRPKAMCIEDLDGTGHTRKYLESHGYTMTGQMGYDQLFVRND